MIGQLDSAGRRVHGVSSQEPTRLGNVAEATPSSTPCLAQHEQEQLFSHSMPAEERGMEGEAGGSQGAGMESRGWRFRWLPEWLRW